MTFRVGQIVVLINNDSMGADLGTIAVVYRIEGEFLYVNWNKPNNGQGDGGYYPHQFRPLIRKDDQLLFSFMEK